MKRFVCIILALLTLWGYTRYVRAPHNDPPPVPSQAVPKSIIAQNHAALNTKTPGSSVVTADGVSIGTTKSVKHLGKNILEHVRLWVDDGDQPDKKIPREALLLIRPEAEATVLICHGFMCNKYDVGFLRFIFNKYNVMTFDFRAHGAHTEDQCCTFGFNERYEVKAMVKYLKSHKELNNKPIIAYGFSMGAAAVILAQAEDPDLFKALILDCPFDSTDNILARGLDQLKFNIFGYEMSLPASSLIKSYAYTPYVQSILKYFLKTIAKLDASQVNTCIVPVSPMKAIEKVKVPALIIGCIKDEKVPLHALLSVYNASSSSNIKCWVTKGDRHYDSVFNNPELYAYKTTKFITKFLAGACNKPRRKIIYDDLSWATAIKKETNTQEMVPAEVTGLSV